MSHLRHQMIRAMELKDFSPRTHQSYLAAVEGLAKFHKKPPDRLTQTDVDDYLLHLKETGKSPSTRNVVISGLRFFYHHTLKDKAIVLDLPSRRKPRILPEVLSREQVGRIIDAPGRKIGWSTPNRRLTARNGCPITLSATRIALPYRIIASLVFLTGDVHD